jgi:hypothetical protein
MAEYNRRGEILIGLSLIEPIYGSFMFSMFFFLDFDVLNQLVREVLGIKPQLEIFFLPFIAVEFIGSGVITTTGTLISQTALLSVRSMVGWLHVITPKRWLTRNVSCKKGDDKVDSGVNVKVCTGVLMRPKVALDSYTAFQIVKAFLDIEIKERLPAKFHHSFLQALMCLFSYSCIKHFHQMTPITLVIYPISCVLLGLFEYLEVVFLSEVAEKSEDFIRTMRDHYGRSKYLRKRLTSLRLIEIDTWFPSRKPLRTNFTHFLYSYSLNTTDLLLTF